ncbi:MAG: LytR/AlgR family response regulator transcription factor [Acutalibacteraceae bacterium]
MRIAICDDSKTEQEQLIKALHGWDPTRLPECFPNGAALLEAAKREPHFDIAFLDIYLPGENGVEIAAELKKISPETGIVFVTTSEEHAVDAFSLHALHYLVKPVTTQGVVEAFRRLTQLHGERRPMATFSTGRGTHTVYIDEIYYLQSMDHAVDIYLTGGRQLRIWAPLSTLEQKLNDSFLRLNRSTIVNMEHIEQMSATDCVMRNGTRLEFTRRDRNTIRAAYDNFLFARLSGRQTFGTEVTE